MILPVILNVSRLTDSCIVTITARIELVTVAKFVLFFQKHLKKIKEAESSAERNTLRMQTMTSVINHRTQSELDRKELAVDLAETLIKANIPVEKLDHPAMRDFLERRVPGAGAIPSANSVRQWYLPTVGY